MFTRLQCGRVRLPCHKYILASRSTYFRDVLQPSDSNAHDSIEALTPLTEVTVDCSLKLLQFVLKYIYTDEVDATLVMDDGTRHSMPRVSSLACQPFQPGSRLVLVPLPSKSRPKSKTKSIGKETQQLQQARLQEIAKKFGIKEILSKR